MDPAEEAVVFREAAARCRKAALSSTNPKEWIFMAEQWEWLAETSDLSTIAIYRPRESASARLILR
jgi:hypothetical protein